MNRIILWLMVLLGCTMCRQAQYQENTIYIDIDHPEKASIFDYFSSVEITPLETDTNVLVKYVQQLIDHQGRYYALDMLQSIIFVFDHDGKYLFQINRQGKGPGEYSSIEQIHINPFTGYLELLSAYGSVNFYDLSGNFIAKKQVSYPGFRAVHEFAAVDSHTHVFYSMFEPKKIIYFDLDEGKLLHEEFEESREIGSFGFDNLYRYHDNWYFFRPFHPHVYKIGKDRLEEDFRFDFGKYTRQGHSHQVKEIMI